VRHTGYPLLSTGGLRRLDHADELAKRFEDYEPSATDERDPAVFAELRRAVLSRSDAERSIRDAVKHAREHGYSWAFIGSLVGTSGEAARQRYGHKQDA
jgi:FAD/FMN-containing dehydrogenase